MERAGAFAERFATFTKASPLRSAFASVSDQSGSAFLIGVVFPKSAVKIEGRLATYETTVSGQALQRHFCPVCFKRTVLQLVLSALSWQAARQSDWLPDRSADALRTVLGARDLC